MEEAKVKEKVEVEVEVDKIREEDPFVKTFKQRISAGINIS